MKWTNDMDAELRRLVAQHKSSAEISRAMGVREASVIARAQILAGVDGRKPLTEEQKAVLTPVMVQWADTAPCMRPSLAAIAARFGVGQKSLAAFVKTLREQGIIVGRDGPPGESPDAIRAGSMRLLEAIQRMGGDPWLRRPQP